MGCNKSVEFKSLWLVKKHKARLLKTSCCNKISIGLTRASCNLCISQVNSCKYEPISIKAILTSFNVGFDRPDSSQIVKELRPSSPITEIERWTTQFKRHHFLFHVCSARLTREFAGCRGFHRRSESAWTACTFQPWPHSLHIIGVDESKAINPMAIIIKPYLSPHNHLHPAIFPAYKIGSSRSKFRLQVE